MKPALFATRRGKLTLLCRATAAILVPTLLITSPIMLQAADDVAQDRADKLIHPDPVISPRHVAINRKKPSFTPPSSIYSLPAHPTDRDIFSHTPFEEPLVPIDGKTTVAENTALGKALTAFSKRLERDDFSSVEDFLKIHPQSPWKISLLTDLGWSYRQTGWYSKAMDTWQQAWEAGQATTDAVAKPIIDRSLVELIVLNARVGRTDTLQDLVKVADTRDLVGSSKEKVEAAKQALQLMKTHPDTSFRCGPMAVEKLRNIADGNNLGKLKVMSMPSTSQGTSMAQLRKLASKLGMDYQVAKRTPGAPILAPAVVNWKLGHFAAIVEGKDDLWHLRDPTFGDDVWISTRALDAEASGYFLVKAGTLPKGWQAVSDTEAATVWGKGQTNGGNPNDNGDPNSDCGCPGKGGGSSSPGSPESSSQPPHGIAAPNSSHGMARYSIYEMLASLSVKDTPLFYQPPYGPAVEFSITYSQRESNQPSTFTYSNLGPLWTFNWLSYLVDDPANPVENVNHYLSAGGTLTYSGYNTNTHAFQPQSQTGCVLKRTGSSSYELDEPDGSKQIYDVATNTTPRKVFLTQTIDPQGNGLTFSYDMNYNLVAVTDALGQVTTLYYTNTDATKVTQVTDPFGRSAYLSYNMDGTLHSSTDMIGLVTTYAYTHGTLTSYTTPYGTTKFSVGENFNYRWVQATDPQGGIERVETWPSTNPAIPAKVTAFPAGEDNYYLNDRNTYYWDKKAMLVAPGDYTQAEITHWLHEPGYGEMSGQIESIKEPLESRVYYSYPNQPSPIIVGTSGQPNRTARIMDDGTTQQTFAAYNALNMMTQFTDARGRVTNYTYDTNQVDLTGISQQNGAGTDVLSTVVYNSQHEPTSVTDASGQVTTYTYYGNGQVHTITNAKSETTTFAYTSGYLTSITGPVSGSTTTFTYDSYGRVATITDVNGYTLTYDYDDLNRVTKVTYPDGTYDQNAYTNLDVTQTRDRQGRWTRYTYNPLQQVTAIIDSANRVTNYDRCVCGQLKGLIDPLGRRTSWEQDIEGRTTSKKYADNTLETYVYENTTSRLRSVTDAKSQVTTYTYNADDTLNQVLYTNASVATPAIGFAYDSAYPRLMAMTDGTGTTTYAYNAVTGSVTTGAGRLATVTGPLGGTSQIAYTYDELGRVTATAINSVSSSVTYDSLGRITGASNPLGSFTYGYYGVTPRLETVTNPNGQSTSYSYLDSAHDFRLSEIKNLTAASAVLSQNDYTYNPVGTMASWRQQVDSNTPTAWNYGYDGADQLLSAVKTNTSNGAVQAQYYYGYDQAGNRTREQIGLGINTSTYNGLNQLTGRSAGGSLLFTGSLNKAGGVTVAGNTATVDANHNFAATATVTTGTNTVAVVATNLNGYASTNNYQVVIPPGTSVTPSYDLNGNLTNNGTGQTYTWDAKDELVGIAYSSGPNSGNHTEFAYDGRGRRVKVMEKTGTTYGSGSVINTKQFVWIDNTIVEERNGSNVVTKRFYAQGMQVTAATAPLDKLYYTRDHLNSVREMTNSSGTIVARYDYDPYGRTTLVQGTNLGDYQYAEMYMHQTSGLYLTNGGDGISTGRPYDPNTGRWISRDPYIDEDGNEAEIAQGPNLYQYVDNDPIDLTDPLGLSAGTPTGGHWHPAPAPPDPTPYGKVLAGFMIVPVVAVGSIPELGIAVAARLGLGGLGLIGGGTAVVNGMNGQSSCPTMTEAQAAAAALGKGPLANPGGPLTPQMIQALQNNLAASQNNLSQAMQGLNRAGNPISPAQAALQAATAQSRINEINQVLSSGAQAPKN